MKFYIFSHSRTGNICNYMLADLMKHPDVRFVYEDLCKRTSANRYLRKAARILSRCQWTVRKHSLFKQIRTATAQAPVCVLITNEAMQWLTEKDMRFLRDAKASVCALLIDPITGNYPSASCARALIQDFAFDRILTFDPEDAKTHNWTYCNCLYSAYDVPMQQPVYDLFYIGTVKNRVQACRDMIKLTQNNNICACFKLLCFDPQTAKQLPPEAVLDSYIPYPALLELLQDARCIFDMTQAGQSGVTLRYYEAVVYNKKLLTNNSHIKKLPFYDSRFMHIYKDLSDIDWNWVKDPVMPDYGYDGRFSPVNLLSLLEF